MRTVIDVDKELLETAQRELGTRTMKETVEAALRLVADRADQRDQPVDVRRRPIDGRRRPVEAGAGRAGRQAVETRWNASA
ncbi:type II toxin-antitoxin system VapB family antitoxin [Spongiactinospora sp. TRM90649]|uniref:type II toxin-antitoxin system VapB family antitoxin n=1 Tax=Spongiactinospora sp. TRM90649 TaxID=3031114 RepID=UPI0023F9EA4E|nr:type II toxin-antitoxin system VapB family antitoxin [Spongiactinospora sp. TRM90649]MDF5751338.1 type II toxin-antitoxin system VapB family antitoxin [Spongiactinospora sp. TRM90649]